LKWEYLQDQIHSVLDGASVDSLGYG